MGFNKRIGRNQKKRQHPTTEHVKTIRKCSIFLLGALCHLIYLQHVKTHLPIHPYLRSQSRLKEKRKDADPLPVILNPGCTSESPE